MSLAIQAQPLILTVNQRLAAYLRNKQDRAYSQNGKTSWVSPSILPFETWVKSLWLDHTHDSRFILSPYSEGVLWGQIIQKEIQHLPFVQRDSLVHQIQQAWQFLNQWNISISTLKQYALDDTHHFFIRVAKRFEAVCSQQNVISFPQVLSVLLKQPFDGLNYLPHQISLVGFDDISPQLSIFLKNIASKTKLQQMDFYEIPRNSEVSRISFPDQMTEIEQAAQWARRQVEMNPDAEVNCVFLNLSDIQDKVKQTFRQIFSSGGLAFNFSLGHPLANYPVIRTAITTLAWGVYPVMEIARIRAWLYSPFLIASEAEMMPRVALSVRLLEQGVSFLNWETLFFLLSRQDDRFYSPQLAASLKKFGSSVEHLKTFKQYPNEWAEVFAEQLQILGWPGQRALDDQEYQTVERFWEALATFGQLNHILQKITRAEAFDLLIQLMDKTLFQPNTVQTNSIQVMGVLESSGILSDSLWVGGMQEDIWPGKPRPNPFIPIELQKKTGMPHASSEREFLISRRITKRLFQSADQIVLSYSRTAMDMPPAPSALIHSVKEITFEKQEIPEKFGGNLPAEEACEMVIETLPLPVQTDESVRGGTGILKNQAACSFKAFAQSRLGALRPQKAPLGLSALDKGNLVHRVLEVFWKTFKSQKDLLALPENELQLTLVNLIDQAFHRIMIDRPWLSHSLLIQAEKQRIAMLLWKWFMLEKQRPPFKVISVEKAMTVTLNGIPLSVKMDRMDQLEDGSCALIDYKTGKVSVRSWGGDRLDEPQLPFYWVMSEELISAIAYAQIHIEGVEFKGVSQISDILPGVLPINRMLKEMPEMNWSELKGFWKQILGQLWTDFYEGKIRLDPKKGKETCGYCGFQALCRVHEMNEGFSGLVDA